VSLNLERPNYALIYSSDALKSQLVGLVSGSIESKLNILEKSLHNGTISETGLGTIRALHDDLV
jgi:hypothetical protein